MGKQKDMRMRRRGAVISVTPSRKKIARGYVPYTLYDTALTELAYGNPAQMGDLFGDIMGAVVGKENWDARPDWMKKVIIKPDPGKIFSNGVKAVPPGAVGNVVRQAEKAGLNIFYNTPAGHIPVTPETAESVYGNFPAFVKTRDVFASVPWWVYAVGGLGVVFAFSMRK